MQLRPSDKILRFFIPAKGMIRSMQFVDNDNCLPCRMGKSREVTRKLYGGQEQGKVARACASLHTRVHNVLAKEVVCFAKARSNLKVSNVFGTLRLQDRHALHGNAYLIFRAEVTSTISRIMFVIIGLYHTDMRFM